MKYINFSQREKEPLIPKIILTPPQEDKGGFINSNKISQIKTARGLDRYISRDAKKKKKKQQEDENNYDTGKQ